MKTWQLTIDEGLAKQVDRLVKLSKATRSAFTRELYQKAVKDAERKRLQVQDRRGYEKQPITADEFEPLYKWSEALHAEEGQWIEVKSGGSRSPRRTKGGRSSSSRNNTRSNT